MCPMLVRSPTGSRLSDNLALLRREDGSSDCGDSDQADGSSSLEESDQMVDVIPRIEGETNGSTKERRRASRAL